MLFDLIKLVQFSWKERRLTLIALIRGGGLAVLVNLEFWTSPGHIEVGSKVMPLVLFFIDFALKQFAYLIVMLAVVT